GNSYGKGIGVVRFDDTLPRPALPAMPGLDFAPVYVGRYAARIEEANRLAIENDQLLHRIHQNILKAERNRYNLEVFLSISELTGYHTRRIIGSKKSEDEQTPTRAQSAKNRQEEAIGRLVGAYDLARNLVKERVVSFQSLQRVWEKSRFAKG